MYPMRTNSIWRGFLVACMIAAPIGCGPVDNGGVDEESDEIFMDEQAPDDGDEQVHTGEMDFPTYGNSSIVMPDGTDTMTEQ
jgi:hypothetical protein